MSCAYQLPKVIRDHVDPPSYAPMRSPMGIAGRKRRRCSKVLAQVLGWNGQRFDYPTAQHLV